MKILSFLVAVVCAVAMGCQNSAERQQHPQPALRMFILTKEDIGVGIEEFTLETGETRVFQIGGESKYLYPVIVNEADLVVSTKSRAISETLKLTNVGDSLTFEFTVPPLGSKKQTFPAKAFRDVSHRVSLVSFEGVRSSFVIRSAQPPIRDDFAPAIDPLAKTQPLLNLEFRVTTTPDYIPNYYAEPGIAELEYIQGHMYVAVDLGDGESRMFVLDTAASATSIFAGAEPRGLDRRPLANGEGKFTFGGVSNPPDEEVLIRRMKVGTAELSDLWAVLEPRAASFLRHADGVLGMDVLRQFPFVTISSPERNAEKGAIAFTKLRAVNHRPSLYLPFSIVRRVPFMRGRLNGLDVDFLIDSGFNANVVPPDVARLASVTSKERAADLEGVDGRKVASWKGTVAELRLGSGVLRDIGVRIGVSAVFEALGITTPAAILGAPFLRFFDSVEFDFERNIVSFSQSGS